MELNKILSHNILAVDTDFSAMIKVRKNRLIEGFHLQTTLLCLKDRAVSSPDAKSIALFLWLCALPKYALCAKYFKLMPFKDRCKTMQFLSSFFREDFKYVANTAFKFRP